MDARRLFQILRRRWILTSLLLLLSLAGAAALAARPGPYQSQSQVLLLPSKQASKANGSNPYLSFDESDTLTADIVRREVTDPRTVADLAALGYSSSYQIVDDPNTAGPVLDITVIGNQKSVVEHTLYGVTSEIATKLAAMQTGISPDDLIRSSVVSVDLRPTLLISKKARTVLVALGLGLVLTICLPQVADAEISRRRARRQAANANNRTPGNRGPDDRRPDNHAPDNRAPGRREYEQMGHYSRRPPSSRRQSDPRRQPTQTSTRPYYNDHDDTGELEVQN